MSNYSKVNIIYFLQKWMDSVAGQTFLNYAYSWGAAIVILGTLFKLTHLPGANTMLFVGMGTEVVVFFISAFDRPFDKSTIDMTLDNHMADNLSPLSGEQDAESQPSVIIGGGTVNGGFVGGGELGTGSSEPVVVQGGGISGPVVIGGSIGGGRAVVAGGTVAGEGMEAAEYSTEQAVAADASEPITFTTPAPAVTQETAEAMETATTTYVERLNELNETFEKVAALSARLATDSEEMENLNRTLTGISRVYEMQLKSASQQITTQDEINEQTRKMAQQIQELNAIYTRMIEAMTVNMSPLAAAQKA